MTYALSLTEDGRVLSVTFPQYGTPDAILVDELPAGDISAYRYEAGRFVYDPIFVEEVEEQPTQMDRLEAQVVYTAMMTDTLLED